MRGEELKAENDRFFNLPQDWKPTGLMRWLETKDYSPITDSFERVLQQQWKSNTGNIKWEDVEIVIERT